MLRMAAKPKSTAKSRKAKPRAKAPAKVKRIPTAKPRRIVEPDPEPDPFMVVYDIVILSPDGTYDIDSMEVIYARNYTARDAVKCYRVEHPELDPQAQLAVLMED
jgi:hypothetical protein